MLLLASWVHDLSPFVLKFSDEFGIRWYGLSYAASFLLAWLMLRWLASRGASAIPRERAGDVILIGVAGVVIGGRLGYVLFYQPSLMWSLSNSPPWWGVLAINQGGMASHGGVIGVIIAAWFVSRGFKTQDERRVGKASMLYILDTFALLTPSGLLMGRLANFVNGELLGRVVANPGEPGPWWAVKFPQEIPDEYLRWQGALNDRPSLLSAEQWQGLTELVSRVTPGKGFEAGYRRLLELEQHERGNTLADQLAPFLSARHPSQLYQAFAEGVVVGALVWAVAAKPRRAGVVGSWFMISYGVLRIITEQYWRLPDALKVPYIAGLTRGQWLSIGMIIAGLVGIGLSLRPGRERLGGWLRPGNGPEQLSR
jgi:phosphatidylglycerol---prolipoprotein diacylglyceryl transferase